MEPINVLCGVIVQNGKVFAARKPKGKPHGGLWEFPGGKQEAGESEQDCLARELSEELRVNANIKNLISRQLIENRNSHFHLIAYFVDIGQQLVTPTEHDKMMWLDDWQLFSLQWSPADIDIVKLIVQKIAKMSDSKQSP